MVLKSRTPCNKRGVPVAVVEHFDNGTLSAQSTYATKRNCGLFIVQLSLFDAIEIPLTKGYMTLVDPVDSDLAQFKWYANINRLNVYAIKGGHGKTEFLHRIVLSRMLNRTLNTKEFTDHINGNSLDNRRCNLRLATLKQNTRNARKPKTNKSGYKGVYYVKRRNKWGAQIRVDGRSIYLGLFDNPETGYIAYCEAAKKYHGEFARVE
jgi:hypothetical protein